MKKLIIATIIIIFFSVMINSVSAQGFINSNTASTFTNTVGKTAGFAPTASIGLIVATIIKVALSLLSIIFIVLIIVAGFHWMTASGNEETIKKAQNIIKSALIGLIIILAAWAITYFIFTYLPFSSGASNNLNKLKT